MEISKVGVILVVSFLSLMNSIMNRGEAPREDNKKNNKTSHSTFIILSDVSSMNISFKDVKHYYVYQKYI